MDFKNSTNEHMYAHKTRSPIIPIIYMLITFFIIIFALYLKNTMADGQSEFIYITYFAICSFLWICISWYTLTKAFFNMYMLFIMLSIPFYLGQPIALLIRPDLSSTMSITIYSCFILDKTIIYVIISYLSIHLGALVYMLCNHESKLKKSVIDYSDSMNKVGFFLLIISIIPTVIILFNSFKAVAAYGYVGLFIANNTLANCQGILGVIAGFGVPALYMLIISNSSLPSKRNKYISFLILYILAIFFLGKRGDNTIQIIGLLFIWHTCIKSISGKAIVKLLVCGTMFLFFLSIISSIRASLNNGNLFILIERSLKEGSDNNYLLNMLKEYGSTLIVPATVIKYCPSVLPYYDGKTIINFFLMLIPNFFWTINPGLKDGTIETIFTPFLSSQSVGGFGSSYIAEMYYNFGNWGFLLFPTIGIIISKLSIRIENVENKLKLFSSIYLFNIFLWYIRGEIMTSGKSIVYYIIFPVFLVKGLQSLYKKVY